MSKLPADVRDTYDTLKAALLERDESNVKNAAATFWTMTKKKDATALEHRQQLTRLVDRFLEGDDRASIINSLVKERMVHDLPKEGRIYVRQRKPKSSLEASSLAEELFLLQSGGELLCLVYRQTGSRQPQSPGVQPKGQAHI